MGLQGDSTYNTTGLRAKLLLETLRPGMFVLRRTFMDGLFEARSRLTNH